MGRRVLKALGLGFYGREFGRRNSGDLVLTGITGVCSG